MSRSMRFSTFDFDQSKYDSFLADIKAIDENVLNGISGLIAVRAVRTSEDHMMVMSTYNDLASLDAATELHRSIFAGFSQYIVGTPTVRSGEVVGEMDGNTSRSDMGYMRFTRVTFDETNFDAIKNYMDDNLAPAFDGVDGLSRIRVVRLREGSLQGQPAVIAAAAYDNEGSAQAATPNAQKALGGISGYMTSEPFQRQGNIVWEWVSSVNLP